MHKLSIKPPEDYGKVNGLTESQLTMTEYRNSTVLSQKNQEKSKHDYKERIYYCYI